MKKIILIFSEIHIQGFLIEEDLVRNVLKVKIDKVQDFVSDRDMKSYHSGLSDQFLVNRAYSLSQLYKQNTVHYFSIASVNSYYVDPIKEN